MKILVDMNLSPQWVPLLREAGHEAAHWSTLGAGNASDHEILRWAAEHRFIIFTHDLDFGALLAAAQASAPSVFQVRTQDVSPAHLGPLVLAALNQFEQELGLGALVALDELRRRVRILPITRE